MAPGDEAVDDVEAVEDDGGLAAKDLLLDEILLSGDADRHSLFGNARLAEDGHLGGPLIVPEDEKGTPALALSCV